jgi:hypothetical protein
VTTTRDRLMAGYCLAVAALAATAANIGITERGSGATADAVSILGEHYSYVTDGVYANNAVRVVAEGIGWDAVTLFFAVPAMLVAAFFIGRGSLRGRLAALGLFGYFAYQYLMYAMFWAIGPLFPLFVLIYPLSLLGIAWIVATLDVGALASRVGPGFPRRTVAIFAVAMSLMLVAMWVPRIVAGIAGDPETAGLLGTPTLTVQAMDLGLIVPLALATAALVWRRHRFGYVLGALFTVKAVTMAGAIMAMLVSAWMVEGSLEVVPFAIFVAATTFAGTLAAKVLASCPDALESGTPVVEVVEAGR